MDYSQHFHLLLARVTYVLESLRSTQSHNPWALGPMPNTSQKSIMYISFLHNTSQRDQLSTLGIVPNHIINKSSISCPMPSTSTLVLVQEVLCPIYNYITKQ